MGREVGPKAALVALGALLLVSPAAHPLHARAAEAATPGAPAPRPVFGNSALPYDISADSLEVDNADNKAIWRGSVEAIQGMDRLRTPQLTVYFAKQNPAGQKGPAAQPATPPPGSATAAGPGFGSSFGSIQKMEAEGPVYYVTPTQNARGDHAVYDAPTNTIVMTGNVVVVQDKNVVQGDKLTIDTQTNHSVLVSNADTRTQKRVRGVFYQDNANQQPQAGSAKPAAAPTPAQP